jgi:catechol 2,3-dioxygenase-like lactoylglutathione lyase family enzyme
MHVETLDHIALWSGDREAMAEFAMAEFGMHVIERTDKFTLIGADARRGKLTLFEADGPRDIGPLAAIKIVAPEGRAGEVTTGPEDLRFELVEDGSVPGDVVGVTLRAADPDAALADLAELGFSRDGDGLRAGASEIELVEGAVDESERPLLNHLGLRVESAEDHLQEAKRRGLEIADVVDGPNTYAVFIWGPERVKLEYVEHKESFSLV